MSCCSAECCVQCAALLIGMCCMAADDSSTVTSLTVAVEGNVTFSTELQNNYVARCTILDGCLLHKPNSLNFSRNILRGFYCASYYTYHLEVGSPIPLWFIYQNLICGCMRYGCLATDGNWNSLAATTLLRVDDLDFGLWHTHLVAWGTKLNGNCVQSI